MWQGLPPLFVVAAVPHPHDKNLLHAPAFHGYDQVDSQNTGILLAPDGVKEIAIAVLGYHGPTNKHRIIAKKHIIAGNSYRVGVSFHETNGDNGDLTWVAKGGLTWVAVQEHVVVATADWIRDPQANVICPDRHT